VDIGVVTQGPMLVTINEEAYTRAAEYYVVSAPISGRLLRVILKPGDIVLQGKTVVAHILPIPLSRREVEQKQATIQAAEASVAVAQSALKQAESDKQLANQQAQRADRLLELDNLSTADYEEAQHKAKNTIAAHAGAESALAMRRSELSNAQAALIGQKTQPASAETIAIMAPTTGQVLRVIEENETVLVAGAPILELADLTHDLKIAVELLSSDALKIHKGQRVIVDNWGGSEQLRGVVSRIDPRGFIKTSALGVEDRRVNAIVQLHDLPVSATGLGHGFRVDVAIVVWNKDDAIKVSTSALFRDNGEWAVFIVDSGKARLRQITVEKNNGTEASIESGIFVDERVILYPAAELADGMSVAQR